MNNIIKLKQGNGLKSCSGLIKIAMFFCVFFLNNWGSNTYAQGKHVQFTHLTTANGLSQSTVMCILKDKFGFMWFGTQDGLNKYDGYKFKVYRNDPQNKSSIANNNIKCLLEDHSGNLWVGTAGGGLELYDRNSDSFISIGPAEGSNDTGSKIIKAIYEDSNNNIWVGSVSEFNVLDVKAKKMKPFKFGNKQLDNITCIYEDKQKNLWVGTIYGLYKFNKKASKLSHFVTETSNENKENSINAIIQDKFGNIWIGTIDGISLFNEAKGTFTNFKKDANDPTSLRDNIIKAICNADDGKLWIGTEQALELFDPDKKTFTHFQQSSKDVRSLSSSSISSLFLDDQGILWVGTYAKGINKHDKNQSKFDLYKNFGTDKLNINSNIVTSFSETADGIIWVGTDGTGLYRWNTATNKFTPHNPAESKDQFFASLSVLCLQLTRDKNNLWIGTYDGGLAKINLKTGAKSYYLAGTTDKNISNQSVYAVMEDKKGNIWLGTNGGGVNVLNPVTNKVRRLDFKTGKQKYTANYIRCLYEDKAGNVWIGTVAHGIIIYNPNTGKYVVLNKATSNLGSDVVFSIYCDSKNNIWVGTMGGGLCKYIPGENKFEQFTESNGLANNIVNSIVEDKYGYLWITTNNGISRFDINKKLFKNYNSASGLQSNEFCIGAGCMLSTGEIVFGGFEGFNVFTPENLKDNPHIPPVVITDFQLFNKPVPITIGEPPLSQNISTVKKITLSHSQSVFTIEFAALGYTVPEKNRYAYKLEGFDNNWNYINTKRTTTYTNLDPGEYTFKVKASNNDGLWNNKGTTLKIIIMPPFWKTDLAYLVYILLISGLLYFIYKEITSREKLKNEVHYQKLVTEKTQELNQLKLNFFTNLSHELRTPLSLIIDPLRNLKNEDITVLQAKKYSNLVFNNASILMNLVNQLLDFRKAETGAFKLDVHKIDAIAFIKHTVQAFTTRASERNIEYYLDLKLEYLEAWIDTDKLEKILYNLISNAFKYTPDFGIVMVLVTLGEIERGNIRTKALEIHIKDSGIGIPEDLKTKIFDIFYQIKGSTRFEKESSGVGLALTRELVLLHKGEIMVTNAETEGTDFIVKLPFSAEDYIIEGKAYDEDTELTENMDSETENLTIAVSTIVDSGKIGNIPIILVVEDNQELREYIADELQTKYHIEQAVNGVEGFKKALEFVPDIVISDIMMTGGDGLEFCHKLKSEEKTSHIPVILLTAKQTDESKIEGYNSGADDYISKPFNVTLLAARINNILESRKKLRELFSIQTEVLEESSIISEIDKEFLKKAIKIIDENMSSTSFDIDKLATVLKMSRRQLYRKLNALTNQTAHDFITNTRLEHAAKLLLTGEFNISEISYKVGFSEPSNFSRSFNKKYGKSPKKFLAEKKP